MSKTNVTDSDQTIRVHLPLDGDIYEGLLRRARRYGFDSGQVYTRVWAKAEVEGRRLYFEEPVLGEAAMMAMRIIQAQLHEHLILTLNYKLPPFKNAYEAIHYICERYKQHQAAPYFDSLFEDLETDERHD